jgi:hypothetical protein
MTTYRLWPSTSGPSSPVSYSGNFISGMTFCVTSEAWFMGYWWWVCGSGGQSTGPTKCALWQVPYVDTENPVLVPGSMITSGTLTAGQWNYIPLPTPIALSLGGSPGMTPPINGGDTGYGLATYAAAIGCNGPFPDTGNYWGTGQTAPDGITNGPLTAYSGTSAGMPAPWPVNGAQPQGCFSVAGSDPSVTFPGSSSGTDNFWVDVQVGDYSNAPVGTSLRLFPNMPAPINANDGDTTLAVSATAFSLSEACSLDKIWMFSPPGATVLPTRTAIWNTSTQTEVPGTDNTSPSWQVPGGGAAAAADGWIYVDYSSAGIVLPAGHYATSFYNGSGEVVYGEAHNMFFAGTDPVGSKTVGGPAWNGISWGGGILTAPNVANGPEAVYDNGSGTFPGNGIYRPSGWGYPTNFESSSDWGEWRGVDVEVTPASGGGGAGGGGQPPTTVNSAAFLTFFP